MRIELPTLGIAWPLAGLLLLPALTRAETAVQAWVQRYNGPGNGYDRASSAAVDSSNNVIVTGYSMGNGSYNDFATVKYSSAGLPLWTNRYNGPANSTEEAYALAVDGNNDVIVVGHSLGSGSSWDYATVKYSSAGEPLWTNRFNGPGNATDEVSGVAVDGSNNVIVTGNSYGSGNDYATIKYSSAGEPLWTNRYTRQANNDNQGTAVAVDGSNNVLVTGFSYTAAGLYDYVTIKYSSAGAPLWTNHYNGPGNSIDQAVAVAVDGSNNVLVTGHSYGSGSGDDYATIKYSSLGVPLWTNRYNGPGNSADQPTALAVDGSNNVIVTGYSTGSGSGLDYTTIKYSSPGVPLWTNRYNGPANSSDYANALAVDDRNNVLVSGYSPGSGSGSDYVTIKYSSPGVPLWTNGYNGPADSSDYANALAVDGRNNVMVAGYSTGSGSGYDYATIKYVCAPSPLMTALQLTNGMFQLRVDDVLQPGTLVIEASTNLAGWAPVFTNTTPTNLLFYTDPDAGDYLWRFYRAFQSP